MNCLLIDAMDVDLGVFVVYDVHAGVSGLRIECCRAVIPLLTGCLFRLMKEATIRSRKNGEKNVSAKSVRKVTEVGVH